MQDITFEIDSTLRAIASYGVDFRIKDMDTLIFDKPFIIGGYFKVYEAINEPFLKLIKEDMPHIFMAEQFHFEKPNKEALYQSALEGFGENLPKDLDQLVEHTYQMAIIKNRRKEISFTDSFLTIINQKIKELFSLIKELKNATDK